MKQQQLTNLNHKQQNLFPTHPSTAYNLHLSSSITSYIESYHCSDWIQFQDNIQYQDDNQYLKRYYRFGEFANKIKLLADYYRYHFQVPRIFVNGVARILQDNVDDRRQLEYALVTKQMNKQQDDDFLTINTHRGIQKHQKLIKDIQLSYEDFEQKPIKKEKQENLHKKIEEGIQKSSSNASLQRPMTRVDSIKFKGSFLVFKPRSEPVMQEKLDQKNKMIEPKYKKPRQIKEKQKEREKKSKRTSDMNNLKVNKKQTSQKQKQKSKNNSKMTSVNNSVASQKGLSRSKSRTHLNLGGLKGKNIDNQNNVKNKNQNKQKPGHGSLQNSLAKSCSKNQILGQKKGITNAMSRKGSRIDLKIEDKQNVKQSSSSNCKNTQNDNEKTCKMLGRKESAAVIQMNKKMFSRALEIKKRKQ